MDEIKAAFAHQLADLPRSREPAPIRIGNMHGRASFLRARSQERIANRNQFRGVAAVAQALQKEQSLMLPSAIFAAEVDNEGAHAQASPGLGQERWASFSPASSRPSLRYFR